MGPINGHAHLCKHKTHIFKDFDIPVKNSIFFMHAFLKLYGTVKFYLEYLTKYNSVQMMKKNINS